MTIREVATASGVDTALVSKFEKGKRIPTVAVLEALSLALDLPLKNLKKSWLAERVYQILNGEDDVQEVLALAESRIEYLSGEKALLMQRLGKDIQEKLEEIDILRQRWNVAKPLKGLQLEKMADYFRTAYTYESNRIEGNSLTLQETHLVIHEGLTVGGKSMREHLEAINHAEAAEYLDELAKDGMELSPRVLSNLHYLILQGIDKENAGVYRKVPVRISGSRHIPPQPYQLGALMEDYFAHFQRQKAILHPVILAAEMSERLVSIHPFIDGNGRTSRLVMNLILLGHGYTLANLKGDASSRLAYYRALEAVQVDNAPEHFYHLVLDHVKESLEDHLQML